MVDLFKLRNHQQIVILAGIILIFLSTAIASNFVERIEEDLEMIQYPLHIPFMVIMPLVMLFVAMIRNRLKKAKDERGKSESGAT